MTFQEKYGPWALVTGAGNGLGAEFARQLAELNIHVILVDIDASSLAQVSTNLRQRYGISVKTVVTDMCRHEFMETIIEATQGLDLGLVINNAGIAATGLFLENNLNDHLRVIDLNIRAPLMLSYHFSPSMVTRGHGGLLFISSLSALQGTAYVANYAGTKAWNLIFAEGLWEELRGKGVNVTGFLVGSTRTPGFINSRPRLDRARGVNVMEVEQTVVEALNALGKGPSTAAGRVNRVIAWLLPRLLSRRGLVRLISRTTRAMYEKNDDRGKSSTSQL